MEESDLFGIQNPETEEFGFVSVMGMAEEHFAVGVYLGAEGLYQFLSFQQMAPYVDPLDLLQMPQLQASFENRSQLEKQDRDTIKALRFKFRGRHAWPLFRHYHPGLVPWFIDGPQARFLAHALEQLLDVAPRFETNPSLLDHDDIETYLVRVPRKEDDNLTWDDQMMQIPPPELAPMEFELDSTLLDAVRQLPKQRSQIEVDCFMLPMPVGEQGSRPFYPYIVMLVDHGEGMILGFDMLQPLPSVEAMWSKVPDTFLRQLANTGMRPSN